MHLACARVREMPATGGLWALPSRSVAILRPRPRASGSVCPGMCLTGAMNGAIEPVACAPPLLRCSGQQRSRNTCPGSSARLLTPTRGIVEPRIHTPKRSGPHPIHVLLPFLVPTGAWEAAQGWGRHRGPCLRRAKPSGPSWQPGCISASSGGAASSGCPAGTLTDGPL